MTRLLDALSHMLDPDEREAVRGDLEESGETGARAFLDLLGLVARRQAALWKDWRPWLALASLPLGFVLILWVRNVAASSAIYSWMYVNNWTPRYIENAGFRMDLLRDAVAFLHDYLALAFWSGTVGFVLGSLSRRAVWINAVAFCCLVLGELAAVRPHGHGVNAAAFTEAIYWLVLPLLLRIALILIPALWGMRKGARLLTVSRSQMMLWSAVLLISTPWWDLPRHWIPLAWPVAYMIGTQRWRDA